MPQRDHHRTPTISEAVRDAAAVVNPEGDDGAVLACAAAAAWIGLNPRDRNEDHEADHVLREGVRMAFGKEPPRQVADYLSARGVNL